jgi:hypothetical protein
LSRLDFAAMPRNRGGIGFADGMPPPPLGARSLRDGSCRALSNRRD